MKDSVEKGPEKIKENLDDLKKVMNLEKKMLDNIDEKLINNPSDKKTKSIFDKKLVKLLDNLNGKIEEIKTNLDEKKVDVKELISKAKKAQVKQIIQEDSNQIENKEEVSSNKSNQTEAVNSKKSNHNFEIIKKDAQEVKEIVSNKLKDVLKDKVSSENIEKVSEKISKNEELANLSSEEIEKVVDKAAKKVDKNKNLFGKYKSVDKIALNKVANEVNEQMKMSDFSSKQDAQNSDLKFSSKQINLKVVEGAADKTSTEDSKFSDLLKGDKLKSEIAKPKANVKHVQRNIVEEFKEKNKLIIKQISNYTKAVKLKNGSMMRMVLNPEKLGKVGLHVTIKEGNVTVKFNAQNEQVKQAIEQNFSQLKDNFQKQGLTVNKIEVNVSTDDGNFESKSDAQNFQGKDSEKGFGSKKGNSQNKGFKFMNSEFESKPVSSMDVGEEDNLNIQA